MEIITQQLHDHVTELVSIVGSLLARIKGVPVPKTLREAFERFHTSYQGYMAVLEAGELEPLLQRAKRVGIYGTLTAQRLAQVQDLDDETKALGKKLGQIAEALKQKVDNDPSLYRPLDEMPSLRPVPLPALPASAIQRLEQFILEQEKQDERIKNRLADNDRRLAGFAESLGKVESEAQATLSKIGEEHQKTVEELEAKRAQIDSILGHASGRVIAGDYEKSAASEKDAADWLRVGSLVCMAAIVLMLGYSFWETAKADFEWQKSLFRVILAFLISAPAAYLARESTRHRAQQYHHQQTALDLKAIAPYLSSLPEDFQHRIKSEIAGKLFAGRDLSHVTTESYPINAQEVLMELVRKLGSGRDERVSEDKGKAHEKV